MANVTVAELADALRRHELLEPAQLDGLASPFLARSADANDLARELLHRGWLTAYQVELLLQGRGDELVLGAYQVLDRLGEGGMGQVFKARHQRMGRVVALKLIRKEKMQKPHVVRRFQREIQAAAKVVHPNIVLAFDADRDRKSTRLNSSHLGISYAVFCLKKKNKKP